MFIQQNQQNQQGGKGITQKELLYITDSLKNEEQLAKICVQGAADSYNGPMRQMFSQMAQERLANMEQLLRTMQQPSFGGH
jgi:hypothetical protein